MYKINNLCFRTTIINIIIESVAVALVFMPGLYSTAYRATFPAFYAVASSLSLLSFLLATFLYVLSCLLFSLLISDFRFDLVWLRLSCDHGWIRSGSVNVR